MKKKLTKLLVVGLLCASCGNDNVPDAPLKPDTPGSGHSGSSPETDCPDKEEEIVSAEDMSIYFLFDTHRDVNVNLERANTEKGKQFVSGKMIEVTGVETEEKDEYAGSFTLHLVGTADGKPFDTSLKFEGFVKRMEDYLMGKRAALRLKEDVAVEEGFDLEKLCEGQDLSFFTAVYLSRFVDFYAMSYEGYPFYFTDRDLNKAEIVDIRYDKQSQMLSFFLSYGGMKSESRLEFKVDRNVYYARKVKVIDGFAAGKYRHGVKEHYDIFGVKAVEYDESRYAVSCTGATLENEEGNSLVFEYELCKIRSDEVLARFRKEVEGFKSVSCLVEELHPKMTSRLKEYMERYITVDTPLGDVTDVVEKRNIGYWSRMVDFDLVAERTRHLVWDGERLIGGGSLNSLDVYIDRPKFELVSARFEQMGAKFLMIRMRLVAVNGVVMEGENVLPELRIHISVRH